MRSSLRSPQARVLGWAALALGLFSLCGPATPLLANELQGRASARITQLASVVLADSVPDDEEAATFTPAGSRSSGPDEAVALIVTAAPHTAVSMTVVPAAASDRQTAGGTPDTQFYDGGPAATDAAGRLVLRVGIASGGTTRVIVNY